MAVFCFIRVLSVAVDTLHPGIDRGAFALFCHKWLKGIIMSSIIARTIGKLISIAIVASATMAFVSPAQAGAKEELAALREANKAAREELRELRAQAQLLAAQARLDKSRAQLEALRLKLATAGAVAPAPAPAVAPAAPAASATH